MFITGLPVKCTSGTVYNIIIWSVPWQLIKEKNLWKQQVSIKTRHRRYTLVCVPRQTDQYDLKSISVLLLVYLVCYHYGISINYYFVVVVVVDIASRVHSGVFLPYVALFLLCRNLRAPGSNICSISPSVTSKRSTSGEDMLKNRLFTLGLCWIKLASLIEVRVPSFPSAVRLQLLRLLSLEQGQTN